MKEYSFLKELKERKILLSEGGFGSMLIQRGLQPGDCPDMLNISKPDWIRDIARQYLDAGAEIIHAFVFGASPMKLSDFGLSDRTEEINRAGMKIIKEVVGNKAFISASVGPSGKILKPYGDADPDDLYQGYLEQCSIIVEEGADLLSFETFTDLNEITIGIKAAREISINIPIIATMTFDETPRGFYTIMGTTIGQAVEGLSGAGADIVGSNCGNGLEKMVKIGKEFKNATSIPVIIQSNAGIPETKGGELYYSESPDFFEELMPELIECGVEIIGGCCGTTPEHIQKMRNLIDSRK